MNQYLIFSDLDGTLLNHNNYSFDDASEMLKYIKSHNIPLILSTSKTFSEVIKIQKRIGIQEAFIVENGAGIFIPSSSPLAKKFLSEDSAWIKLSNAKPYKALRSFFSTMQKKYLIKGFFDMSVEEVMELTGLDNVSAQDAMKRDFSEPFILQDNTSLDALRDEAHNNGFEIVLGGRFYHLISQHQDKANAMLRLTKLYNEHYNCSYKTIALGDSANDFKMITKADIGILIPKHDGSYASLKTPSLIKATYAGPKGWNEELKKILL